MIGAVAPREVVVAHGVTDATRPDEADTLEQVHQVRAALGRLGYATRELALGFDLTPLARLADAPPALVFNLVEALAGDGRLIHLPAAVMEHAGLRFTGNSAAALALTTDKLLSKRLLAAAALDVASTVGPGYGAPDDARRYIVKPLFEDASYGIDAASVVSGGRVEAELAARQRHLGGHWFAESYIEGREINVSLIEDPSGQPVMLPPAEIEFVGYEASRPRIVDYEAKWVPESHAYNNTPRRFLDVAVEGALIQRLADVAVQTWHALGLSGYARVDFRVDADERCFVLEANANPCIEAGAGFAAACAMAGLHYDAMIANIVEAALRRAGPITASTKA